MTHGIDIDIERTKLNPRSRSLQDPNPARARLAIFNMMVHAFREACYYLLNKKPIYHSYDQILILISSCIGFLIASLIWSILN